MYLISRSRCISRAIQDHHGPLVFNLFFPRVFHGSPYLKSNGRYQVIFSNEVHLSATSQLPIFGGNKLNPIPTRHRKRYNPLAQDHSSYSLHCWVDTHLLMYMSKVLWNLTFKKGSCDLYIRPLKHKAVQER